MNKSSVKNIVFLKEINSNIVDEAIIILKPNVKVKESIITGKTNSREKNSNNYILNEAELVISNYISKVKNNNDDITRKYKSKLKKMKLLNFILVISIISFSILKIF